jgi:hypothetical protein
MEAVDGVGGMRSGEASGKRALQRRKTPQSGAWSKGDDRVFSCRRVAGRCGASGGLWGDV